MKAMFSHQVLKLTKTSRRNSIPLMQYSRKIFPKKLTPRYDTFKLNLNLFYADQFIILDQFISSFDCRNLFNSKNFGQPEREYASISAFLY